MKASTGGGSSPPGEQPAPDASGKPKLLKRLRRGGPNPAEPRELGFDLASYKKVSVPAATNFSGVITPTLAEAVREAFVLAMQQAGLEVVADGAPAPLELQVAIVDVKWDSTYIYFANIQPFIELELRLRDTEAGENLLLLRNQAHSNTPEDAALNYASSLLKFLR